MRLTVSDLQNLAATLMVNSELIDWCRFLLTAAQPWPVPSVIQLLNTLHSFKAVDEAGSGFVTQEYYNQVGLWFKGSEDLKMPENPTEPLAFNRQEHLIMFFFILFADARKDPSQLDYTKMLLYFASHPDAVEGVYRALSIATGTYIQRRKEVSPPHMSLSHTDMLIKKEPLVEKEKILYCTDEGRISMATLQRVFHHEESKAGDNHRFSSQQKAGSNNKHFRKIYEELGSEDLKPIPVTILLKHPFIQDLINNYQGYKLPSGYRRRRMEQCDAMQAVLLEDIEWSNSHLLVTVMHHLDMVERHFWVRETSTDWWDSIIIQLWDDEQIDKTVPKESALPYKKAQGTLAK
nr:sperm flagellar protein 2-like [Chelonoidis abingdonii]